jgi:hypothetical protein
MTYLLHYEVVVVLVVVAVAVVVEVVAVVVVVVVVVKVVVVVVNSYVTSMFVRPSVRLPVSVYQYQWLII